MKVALVGPTHPAPGGIAHFTAGLAEALREHGPLLVIGWRRSYPARLHPGTTEDRVSRTAVSVDAAVLVLDILDPRTWRRAAEQIQAFGAAGVVLQWVHPIHSPVLLALVRRLRRAGIGATVICHNVEPHESGALWRAITRHTLRRAGVLVVHAPALRAEAEFAAPGVPIVDAFMPILANVASALDRPAPEQVAALRRRLGAEDRRLILTFGYVRPYKGVEDAIAAMAYVKTDAVLLVAGECWGDHTPLHQLAAKPGIEGRVVLDLRYHANDEIPNLFAAADAVVLPYRSATQSAVAALAFAYGRPVVATRVGGLASLVDDGVTGALARPRDPEDLAESIDRVLADDRDWAPAIGDACRERSWARYAELVGEAVAMSRPLARDAATHAVLDVASRRRRGTKIVRILTGKRDLAGARVLDIGTGSGTIASVLADQVGASGRVESVDVTDVRVQRDGYTFTRYDGVTLPFPDGAFDIVVSNHVIEHVGDRADQRRHMSEIARVLAPAGLVYVAVPHRFRLVENHHRLPFLGWLPRPVADRYMRAARRGARYDCRPLSRRALAALSTQAGLRPTDATRALVDATADLRDGLAGRILARLPSGARRAVIGPAATTIVITAIKDGG